MLRSVPLVTDQATVGTIAAGLAEADGSPVWTRSVWVGVVALIPIAGLAFFGIRRTED